MEPVDRLRQNLDTYQLASIDERKLEVSDLKIEAEGRAYVACNYRVNGRRVMSRHAKTTPKKVGQFVTCWKRNSAGFTVPFDAVDPIDYYVIHIHDENRYGQFVFPRAVLIERGIMTVAKDSGKRGFRVYPTCNTTVSAQARKTQAWMSTYFYDFSSFDDGGHLHDLYTN